MCLIEGQGTGHRAQGRRGRPYNGHMNKRSLLIWALMLALAAGCGRAPASDDPAAAGQPGDASTLGPNLAGVAARAAANPDGLEAAPWLRRETLQPDVALAPGFAPGLMPATYGQTLDAAEIDALVAYMLTLE
jgi:mono/diheme cytochrome c family protein